MRKKSEARREAILAAAAIEFSEHGYEGASTSAISARAGGSKQTLYSYFPSKEELFIEVMDLALNRQVESAYAELADETGNIVAALRKFGERYLQVRLLPECVTLINAAHGSAGRSNVSQIVYQRGKTRGIEHVRSFLVTAMHAGKLRLADPKVAALHLFGLLDSELIEPILLRVREPASPEEITEVVSRAVSVFLAAYAPPPAAGQ
jgi:AcrR family transcriptional regulator